MAAELRAAEIIAVGSELLTPFRRDTNSLFLTSRLNDLGIEVHAKAAVRDDRRALVRWLREALARVDLVITTGGLGPTEDDVTREAVAETLGLALVEDARVMAAIRERFTRRQLPMPPNNVRQAMVPAGAVVLDNSRGTAPGLLIEWGDKVAVLLPGPPRELEPMFDTAVAPRLAPRALGTPLRRRVVKVTGRSESQVDQIASPIYSALGSATVAVETSVLATPGQIEVHLTGRGRDVAEIDRLLADGVIRLNEALAPNVFSDDGRTLEAVVGDLLVARGWRLAVAESCTAGLTLARLTDVPGSSAWIVGGVVAYANSVKVAELDVPEALLREHGAVSEPVARAMAEGVRKRLGADVGVAITGIAGPGGGSEEKPVGTVVIAIDGPLRAVRTVMFPGDRAAIRAHSAAAAIELVRRAAVSGG